MIAILSFSLYVLFLVPVVILLIYRHISKNLPLEFPADNKPSFMVCLIGSGGGGAEYRVVGNGGSGIN